MDNVKKTIPDLAQIHVRIRDADYPNVIGMTKSGVPVHTMKRPQSSPDVTEDSGVVEDGATVERAVARHLWAPGVMHFTREQLDMLISLVQMTTERASPTFGDWADSNPECMPGLEALEELLKACDEDMARAKRERERGRVTVQLLSTEIDDDEELEPEPKEQPWF